VTLMIAITQHRTIFAELRGLLPKCIYIIIVAEHGEDHE